MKQRRTKAQWLALIQEFDNSGLTPAEFSTQRSINPKYFSLRRITLKVDTKACACLIPKNHAALTLEALTAYRQANGVAQYLWPESVEICSEFPAQSTWAVERAAQASRQRHSPFRLN